MLKSEKMELLEIDNCQTTIQVCSHRRNSLRKTKHPSPYQHEHFEHRRALSNMDAQTLDVLNQ